MATPDFIQKAYIAFFNRPADKDGFNFWQGTNQPDQALLDQFAQSPEYLSDYAGKSNKQIVEIVYNNLFGRGPEKAGLDYWAEQMDKGWVTVGNAAYEILGGAQGTDLGTINNKTQAAQAFTNALGATAEINAYAKAGDNGVGNVAKEWLAKVSHDNGSLNTAQTNLNGILTTLKNANPASPTPKDNVYVVDGNSLDTITLSGSLSETIKWTGFDNHKVTVINFGYGDKLDFTAYGTYAIFSSTLVNGIAEERAIHDIDGFGIEGTKYITLTRPDASTTVYKIELWTQHGNQIDAYGVVYSGGYTSNSPDDGKPDTAQLIGYVDLGIDLVELRGRDSPICGAPPHQGDCT
ncbi:MAG: DUF4214 domain-containing protein [Betaproteobacteria bacterium]|nr:DUF4214 domain-containing protein [Betaproteobacteria bacterium]